MLSLALERINQYRTIVCVAFSSDLQGGYRAWVNAGLPTKDSSDYTASPVDVIGERLNVVTTAATGSL